MTEDQIVALLKLAAGICDSVTFKNFTSQITVAYDFGDPTTGIIWTLHADGKETHYDDASKVAEVVHAWYEETHVPF